MNAVAERTNAAAPIKHYALCNNQGLQVCANCIRNIEHHARTSPHQPMLSPTIADRGRCADWRAM